MEDITSHAEAVVDIWPYVEAIPPDELEGHSLDDVECVYRGGARQLEHILIATEHRNIFLAVVVEPERREILGHYLLDLNQKYSLSPPPV